MSPSRVQPWSQPGDDAVEGPHEFPKPRAVGVTTAKPCFAKNQFVYLSAGFVLSNAVFVWPIPCSRRMVGNGPSPVAGSVTSTSIGVPSKLAGLDARSGVGQKRTPFAGVHEWPNGAGSACAAAGKSAIAAIAATSKRAMGGHYRSEFRAGMRGYAAAHGIRREGVSAAAARPPGRRER